MDDKITKIHCSCGKWIGRIDSGDVVMLCPWCKSETVVEIVTLIAHLEHYLLLLRAQANTLTRPIPQDDGKEPIPRLLIGGAGKRDRG